MPNDHPITQCIAAARAAGYTWSGGEIGRYVNQVLKVADPEDVVRGWTYWLQRAVSDHNEDGKYMSPASFARRSGFWIRMARPVSTAPHG